MLVLFLPVQLLFVLQLLQFILSTVAVICYHRHMLYSCYLSDSWCYLLPVQLPFIVQLPLFIASTVATCHAVALCCTYVVTKVVATAVCYNTACYTVAVCCTVAVIFATSTVVICCVVFKPGARQLKASACLVS